MPAKKKVTAKKSAEKKSPAVKAPVKQKSATPAPAGPTGPPEGLRLAQFAAQCALDKKAEDIVILDLRGISPITDFFVICSGTSLPHLRAIRKEIDDCARMEHDIRARTLDGQPESMWMVIDFFDVMVHVFNAEKRGLYRLEELWSDAPRIEVESG